MKKLAIVGLCVALAAGAAWLSAQEPPQSPAPGAEQAWLEQLAGEWESDGEANLAPGQPPIKSKGAESARMLGEHWVVSEVEATFMDMPFSAVMTLGYDPEKKKFVGTWVDSVSSYFWHYEGTLSADGKTLTLETEGPCVRTPGKHARFRDAIEIKSRNERTLTSRALIDGKWETMVTVHFRRQL